MKMTFQPKKRSRAKVHGFRARMSTPGGRKVLAARRLKGRNELKANEAARQARAQAKHDRKHKRARES